mgnify:FL=1
MTFNQKTVLSNMLWRFAERCGAQGVSFIVSVILARMLLPEEYGVVSIITIFTSILNLFLDSGFKNALIQKRDADEIDYSTVFYFNIMMGVTLYIFMFWVSPFIANFYEMEAMTPYIRILSLTLILGGFNGVQTAIVAKRMEFKRFFYSSLTGTLVSAVIGIAMAYSGMGVWALIAQRLINQLVDTFILWFTVKWRPLFVFSIKRLMPMFRYGSKLLGASLLNSLTTNLSGLLIGKAYSPDLLAYYDKGRRIPNLVVENLQSAVQSVLFPVLAQQQEDKKQVKRILRISFMTAAYCIFPCMVGIGVCAESIIRILYTETWISMVPYLQLWCFIFAFYLMHTAQLQVIQALGRSDIILKIEIIKQIISIAVILLTIPLGVLPMLVAMCVVTVLCLYINAYPNKELVGYGFLEQIKDIVPIILLNCVMGIGVYLLSLLRLPDPLLLLIQVVAGIGIYFAGSYVLKLESLAYVKKIGEAFKKRHH